MTSTAAPHPGSDPGLGRVIAFRSRRDISPAAGTTHPTVDPGTRSSSTGGGAAGTNLSASVQPIAIEGRRCSPRSAGGTSAGGISTGATSTSGTSTSDLVRPLITWATRAELVEHAAYRETPSGRTGWYLGEAHVPALSRLELGDSVLVFRSRGDGQLFTHSLFDTLRGVAFEDVD